MNKETTLPQEDKKKDPLRDLYDFFEMFAIAACVILVLFALLSRLSVVEGTSMEKTLLEGDRLIVSDLFYTPERGDVVVIHSPLVNRGEAIVKRVIATEGDTVSIRPDGVYVYAADGTGGKLEETDGSLGYTVDFSTPYSSSTSYTYTPMTITVGNGEVFVLGDHRSVSYDSRAFGCVDVRTIVGRVYFRVYPFSSLGVIH